MANRKYTDSQRADGVRRVQAGRETAAEVARDMSISLGTLQRWVSDAAGADLPHQRASAADTDGAKRNADLEAQLADMIKRLDVLEAQFRRVTDEPGDTPR